MMPAITGNSEESFTISATIYYPQSAAGNNTVTCGGVLTLSNGTQVTGTTGTEKVTAVAVDSVALKSDLTTQTPSSNETQYFNYQIGQSLTRSDFTITTTPTGWGNYQDPETSNYLVTFSMSPSSKLQIGDNLVTASCGTSSASQTLVGVSATAAWGTVTSGDGSTGNYNIGFTAGLQGNASTTGTYTFTGTLTPIGGDTGGNLASDTSVDGPVEFNDDGSTPSPGQSSIQVLTAAATSPGGSGTTGDTTQMMAGVAVAAVNVGQVAQAAKALVVRGNLTATPKGPLTLTSQTNANNYNFTSDQTTVTIGGDGASYSFLAALWTDDPDAEVACTAPTHQTIIETLQGGGNVSESIAVETGETSAVGGTVFGLECVNNGIWTGAATSQPNDGPADRAVDAWCSLPFNHWDITSSSFSATIGVPYIPATGVIDGNWSQVGKNPATIIFTWF